MGILERISLSFNRLVISESLEGAIVVVRVSSLGALEPVENDELVGLLAQGRTDNMFVAPLSMLGGAPEAKELSTLCWMAGTIDEGDIIVMPSREETMLFLRKRGCKFLYALYDDKRIYGGRFEEAFCPMSADAWNPTLKPNAGLSPEFSYRVCACRAMAFMLYEGHSAYSDWIRLDTAQQRLREMTLGAYDDGRWEEFDVDWIVAFCRVMRYFFNTWNDFVPDEAVYHRLVATLACRDIWKKALGEEWKEFSYSSTVDEIIEKRQELGLDYAFESLRAGVPVEYVL